MLYMRVGHRPVLAKHFQKRRVGITAGTHEKITSVRFQGDSDKITTYGFLDLEKFSLRRNSHTVEKNSITQKIFDDRISKKILSPKILDLENFFFVGIPTRSKKILSPRKILSPGKILSPKKNSVIEFFFVGIPTRSKKILSPGKILSPKKNSVIEFFLLVWSAWIPTRHVIKIYKSRVGHLSPVFKNQWAVESSLQLFPYIYEVIRFGTYNIMLSLSKNALSEFPHGDSYVVKFQSPGQCTSRPYLKISEP